MKRSIVALAVLLVASVSLAGLARSADQHAGHMAMGKGSMSHEMSGKPSTWKGEVLDSGCYLGHGAMGEKHKECALKCVSNGMPMLILVEGKPVLLTMDHDNPDPYNALKAWAGSTVEITGTMMARGGMSAINVTGAKLAK